MYWYNQCVRSFCDDYKQYVKSRTRLLKQINSIQSPTNIKSTVQWNRIYIELRLSHFLRAISPSTSSHMNISIDELQVWSTLGNDVELLDCTQLQCGMVDIQTAVRSSQNLKALKLDQIQCDVNAVYTLCKETPQLVRSTQRMNINGRLICSAVV